METEILSFLILGQEVQFNGLSDWSGLLILLILALLVCSALVSGAEAAYFSLKPNDVKILRECHSRKCEVVLQHLANQDLLLATLLISNTIFNVGVIISSSFLVNEIVEFEKLGAASLILEVGFIATLILFFGEILPKSFAVLVPVKFCTIIAYPLQVITTLLKPLNVLMAWGISRVNQGFVKGGNEVSARDLSRFIDLADHKEPGSKEILKGIVTFGSMNAAQVMTPASRVVRVDSGSCFKEVIPVILESGYSRIPVYEKHPGNITGILYLKDLLPHLGNEDNFEWQHLARKSLKVPGSKRINDLLQEFKNLKVHMAIVVDENNNMAGIITLEDILEEIVGDISDDQE